MGFRERESRRRKEAAIKAGKAKCRGRSDGWWLTIVTATTCCAKCGMVLREGREMVFRAKPLEARCQLHAEGLRFRPSVRWEQQRRGRL